MSRRDDSRKIEQTNTHNPVSRESQDAPERSLESAEDLISASDEERNAARSTSETMNKKFSSVDAKAEEAAEELPPGVLRNLSEYFQEYSNHVAKIETNYVSGIRTLLKTTRNRESAIRNSNVVLQSLLADLQKSTTIARFKENSPTHYNRLLSAIQDVRIDSGTPGEKYEIDAPGMDGPFTLVPVHLISGKYEPGGIEYSVDPKTGVTVRGFRDYRTRDHTFYPLSGNRELYSDLHVIRDPSRKPSEELVAEYSRPVDSSEKRKFMERKKKYNQEMNERSERWKISEDMDSRADQLRDGISHLRGTLAEHGEGFARCVDLMQQKHMHHADLPDGDRNSYYVVSNALQNLQKRLHEPDLIKAMEEQVSGENRRHEEWWESDDGSFHKVGAGNFLEGGISLLSLYTQELTRHLPDAEFGASTKRSAVERGEIPDGVPLSEMGYTAPPSGATYYKHDARHALLGRVIAKEFATVSVPNGAKYSLVFRGGITGERYVYNSINYFFDINDHFQLVMNNQQIDHNLTRTGGDPFIEMGNEWEATKQRIAKEHLERNRKERDPELASAREKFDRQFEGKIGAKLSAMLEGRQLLNSITGKPEEARASDYIRLSTFVFSSDIVLSLVKSLKYPLTDKDKEIIVMRNKAVFILDNTDATPEGYKGKHEQRNEEFYALKEEVSPKVEVAESAEIIKQDVAEAYEKAFNAFKLAGGATGNAQISIKEFIAVVDSAFSKNAFVNDPTGKRQYENYRNSAQKRLEMDGIA